MILIGNTLETTSLKKSIFILSAFICMIFFAVSHAAAEEDWQLYHDKNGIKAFKRKHSDSSYLETKGIAIINSPMEVASTVLDDIHAYPKWMSDCIEARLLETGENHLIIYVAQDVPWPVTDRDVIVKALIEDNWEQGKQTITLHSITYPDFTPVKDRIRMDHMTGKWELEYIDREHTLATYTVFSEPGGIIPAVIANTSVKNVPYISLQGLQNMVKESRYITLGKTSLQKEEIENAIEKGFLKSDGNK